MRLFIVVLLLYLIQPLSGQVQTVLNLDFTGNIIDEANIPGKGVFLLTGDIAAVESEFARRVQVTWVDEEGNLRWSHSLINQAKRGNEGPFLVVSEHSAAAYVLVYNWKRDEGELLVFQLDTNGTAVHYTIDLEESFRGILFATASSKGLHLMVKDKIPKGEEGGYLKRKGIYYARLYTLPYGERKPTVQNMDSVFFPSMVVAGQKGDVMTIYGPPEYFTPVKSDRIVYRYNIASGTIVEMPINTAWYGTTVQFMRPQNGFYQDRDQYSYEMGVSSGGAATSTQVYPTPGAERVFHVNPQNGHVFQIGISDDPDPKAHGRKHGGLVAYLNKVHVEELDTNLVVVNRHEVPIPVELDKMPGRLTFIRKLEHGFRTHVYCSVSQDGKSLQIMLTRSDKSSYIYLVCDLSKGEVSSMKVANGSSFKNKKIRGTYELLADCLMLDTMNTQLPMEFRKSIPTQKFPKSNPLNYARVLGGYTPDNFTLLEVNPKKFIRITRYKEGIGEVKKEYPLERNQSYLVKKF